uniref:Cystatin domain-containing protein n=1 Tax=Podarcis muralis TaxID=64176 RepID=A0A670JUB5_PODMU
MGWGSCLDQYPHGEQNFPSFRFFCHLYIWSLKPLQAQMGEILQVKGQVEEKEGRSFEVFEAVEFKTQIVAGINYFIKVHIGNDEFLHVRVYKRLPHENKPLELTSYQSKKAKHDELAYF